MSSLHTSRHDQRRSSSSGARAVRTRTTAARRTRPSASPTQSAIRADPGIRADKVAAARQRLAEGFYDQDGVLDAALDRLLDRLGSSDRRVA